VDSTSLAQEAHQLRPLKLRPCADCGDRFGGRDVIEVTVEHESLTWFVGDELCEECSAPGTTASSRAVRSGS
jgi:hypothetical protein